MLAAEIRSEALDKQRGLPMFVPAHRRSEMARALVGHVVAIDAREDDVVEPPLRHGLGHVFGLFRIERWWFAARRQSAIVINFESILTRATRGACAKGYRLVLTAQKLQPCGPEQKRVIRRAQGNSRCARARTRVHVSPMIMMVAVAVPSAPPQHSPMFGHRASSQTVASLSLRTVV